MKLKVFFLLLSLPLFATQQTFSQESELSDPEPFFWAIIVHDMDRSIAWYTKNLGLKVLYNNNYEERGFKQAALQRESLLLELVEINTAVTPEEALKGVPDRTRLTGIYKVGFRVRDFDKWNAEFEKNRASYLGIGVVTDPVSSKRMIVYLDPDSNRVQLFEK